MRQKPFKDLPPRARQCLRSTGLALFLTTLLGSTNISSAETIIDTTLGLGIGTAVADAFGNGSGVAIHTSVASVTYQRPVAVMRGSLRYYEVLGSFQGTGWGGELQGLSGPLLPPPEPLPSLAHYSYDIPFVLRWTDGWDGTLVGYAHGYSPLSFSVLLEPLLGNDNEARRFDLAEGQFISDAVIDAKRRHAFFAVNLSGLDRDGNFSAVASEGDFTGLPVNPSVDVPVWRDTTLLAKRLLLKLSGRSVNRTIGVGHSGGALIMQWITSNRGFSLNAGAPLFDGGNSLQGRRLPV